MTKSVRTEWVFCTDTCAVDRQDVILNKRRKVIEVNGKPLEGWMVELKVSSDNEYVPMDYSQDIDE